MVVPMRVQKRFDACLRDNSFPFAFPSQTANALKISYHEATWSHSLMDLPIRCRQVRHRSRHIAYGDWAVNE